MKNWDYKKDTKLVEDEIWRLNRLLNYGLDGEKIDRVILEKNLDKVKIDKNTKAFLELLLWDRKF